MSNKSFSFYAAEDFTVEDSDQLIIEIANAHIICLLRKQNRKLIAAYEFFTLEQKDGENLEKVLAKISQESKILLKNTSGLKVYMNDQFCLPVPIFKFNKEIASEYLNIVFGEDAFAKIQFEHLPIEPGIMNVFRVNMDDYNYLTQNFKNVRFNHTYSNVLRRLANIVVDLNSSFPSELINIQFYNTFMIIVVMKDGNLHLIQTCAYHVPEDVLYYLLNITRQFKMDIETMTLQISGMIDLEFKLYRELITYFKNVLVENVNETDLLLKMKEHPQHYFTPFFNLC